MIFVDVGRRWSSKFFMFFRSLFRVGVDVIWSRGCFVVFVCWFEVECDSVIVIYLEALSVVLSLGSWDAV